MKSEFNSHSNSQKTVIENPIWYGDRGSSLGESFSAAMTKDRHEQVLAILQRAARGKKRVGDHQTGDAFSALERKIRTCRENERCGSQACPICARAFQRAKVAAQTQLITDVEQNQIGQTLVMVTIIPLARSRRMGELNNLKVTKENRWLKDKLRTGGITRMIIGSADLSWEQRKGQGFWQLHWHLAMWTNKPAILTRRLKALFPSYHAYDRPVEVTKTSNLNFLGYMHKVVTLPELLRHHRRRMAEVLLFLDRNEPLDFLVVQGARVSAQGGGLALSEINGI